MEETTIKTGKFGWTYGLLSGIISVVFSLIIYFMDMTMIVIKNPMIQLIGLLIMVIVMILGVVQYKKTNTGYITISQSLKVAVAIGLVTGLISILYSTIIRIVDPELVESVSNYLKQQALTQNPNITDEQWEVGMKIQTYVGYAITIIGPIIIGLIVGAITGAIVQKKRPE